MYRVLVVDDEIWSVIGLKKILQEDADRFQLIYETTDSRDALEQICLLRPDVVFTDVRMPEMSGIELMRNVHKRGIQTEFIVISGFAEFSYVQQALQEGAVDYQLKPFDKSTAKAMLDKLYEKLESKRNVTDLEFYSLLRDRKDNVADLLLSKFGHVLYSKIQIVLYFNIDSASQGISIDPGENAQSLLLKIGPRKCLYIINSDEDKTGEVYDQLRSHSGQIEIAALSRVGSGVEMFEQLLKEAETTLLDFFVYPGEKIFRYRRTKREVVNRVEDRILQLYNARKFQQISSEVDSLIQVFRENNLGIEDAVYFWNRLALHSVKQGNHAGGKLDFLDNYELTERFSDIGEMCSYLHTLYVEGNGEQSGTVNDKFFEMLRYIDKNYAQHLSLKELCNVFYINMSYCCELFQKHKNMTFSQYLTDVRIAKACELIKDQKTTVSDACEMVGYKDYFYFSKVFKKKMGCTPAAYRKNEQVKS